MRGSPFNDRRDVLKRLNMTFDEAQDALLKSVKIVREIRFMVEEGAAEFPYSRRTLITMESVLHLIAWDLRKMHRPKWARAFLR